MEYRGIYFNNIKNPKFYEGGAHFSYKDLYYKLLEISNKANKANNNNNSLNLFLKNSFNEKKIDNEPIIQKIKKKHCSSASKRKTRNKKINNNLCNSDSLEDNHYKDINLHIFQKSTDNKYYNESNALKDNTCRISYYNKLVHKIHHNSINKNYKYDNSNKQSNIFVMSKRDEKHSNMNIKLNQSNKSKNKFKNNNSNLNKNNTIYNYCYLKYENNYSKKMQKLKTNNIKNKSIFNIGIYKYNLYNNIFLKNRIKNKLKQFKQNKFSSYIKQDNNKDSLNNKSNINNKSKNKPTKSKDKYEIKLNTKRINYHVKSVDYASIYSDLNNIKTPTHKIKDEFFKNNKNINIINDSICNINTILNKNKNYENLLIRVNKKDNNSYAKIKKNQLSLNKSKGHYNKEIFGKERLKRDTQSTEYE